MLLIRARCCIGLPKTSACSALSCLPSEESFLLVRLRHACISAPCGAPCTLTVARLKLVTPAVVPPEARAEITPASLFLFLFHLHTDPFLGTFEKFFNYKETFSVGKNVCVKKYLFSGPRRAPAGTGCWTKTSGRTGPSPRWPPATTGSCRGPCKGAVPSHPCLLVRMATARCHVAHRQQHPVPMVEAACPVKVCARHHGCTEAHLTSQQLTKPPGLRISAYCLLFAACRCGMCFEVTCVENGPVRRPVSA